MAQDVRGVMTRDPVTVEANAALIDAARAMRDADIGDVLVTDGGSVIGLVTDRDITVRGTANGADPTTSEVGAVCSRELVALEPGQTVDEAIDLMREHALRRLPVIEDDKPVGIVSLGDLAEQRDRESVLGEVSAAPPNR